MQPKALFLTHSPPRPAISGDRMRTFHLMRELRSRSWCISLFSLVAPGEPAGLEEALTEAADDWLLVSGRGSRSRRAVSLGADVLRRRAFQRDWFWSPGAGRASEAWLAASPTGVLFVEQLYMLPFVPPSRLDKVVLDTQNLEVARIQAMAVEGSTAMRRVVAKLQVGPVRQYEAHAVQSVARVLAVSQDEESAFEKLAPGRVRLVPNGVDVARIDPITNPPKSRRLLYLGSMGYGPNVDAVLFFLSEIGPLLDATDASLDVVGSNPPASLYRGSVRSRLPVTVAGFVPDVDSYYRGSRAMVVPLRHGGGTRLKILEALAWGLPVVTTTVGCAGLGLTDGREALIADTPHAFAAAVDRLMSDDGLWNDLSRAGRAHVERHFDWHAVGSTLDLVMREVEPGA